MFEVGDKVRYNTNEFGRQLDAAFFGEDILQIHDMPATVLGYAPDGLVMLVWDECIKGLHDLGGRLSDARGKFCLEEYVTKWE